MRNKRKPCSNSCSYFLNAARATVSRHLNRSIGAFPTFTNPLAANLALRLHITAFARENLKDTCASEARKMLIIEYRIVLPLTVEEYQVAQLWSVAELSKRETGGGEGIEVLKNEPYEKYPLLANEFSSGQYTHKIYHISSKVPWWVRKLAPAGSLELHEKAWNAYPYCRTVLTNPSYMKDDFCLKTETMHLPDRGDSDNVHQLSPSLLKLREVVYLNIAEDLNRSASEPRNLDPKFYRSEKTGRGPLRDNWMETCEPVMCCYKLVTVDFKWWGLQSRVESFIVKQMKRLFHVFHREVFCWMDHWYGLTMADIRQIEDATKEELDIQRKEGEVRGMTAVE
uniref:Phosphatidylinositol transfer protein n=1 Tax=Trichuris muris TaxID=70415 RepID=A0A5S6QTS6_TRIMR